MSLSLKKWDKKLADSAWEWAKHLAQNRKFETGTKINFFFIQLILECLIVMEQGRKEFLTDRILDFLFFMEQVAELGTGLSITSGPME